MCFDSQMTPAVKEAQLSACSAVQQVVPRPLTYDACLHGFRAGLSSACSSSHHWAVQEASRRRREEEDRAAMEQARLLEETEVRLQAARDRDMETMRAAEAARLAMVAQAAEAARKAADEAAAAESRKKGKTRGAGKQQ